MLIFCFYNIIVPSKFSNFPRNFPIRLCFSINFGFQATRENQNFSAFWNKIVIKWLKILVMILGFNRNIVQDLQDLTTFFHLEKMLHLRALIGENLQNPAPDLRMEDRDIEIMTILGTRTQMHFYKSLVLLQ